MNLAGITITVLCITLSGCMSHSMCAEPQNHRAFGQDITQDNGAVRLPSPGDDLNDLASDTVCLLQDIK
jgi:hypothetical protein